MHTGIALAERCLPVPHPMHRSTPGSPVIWDVSQPPAHGWPVLHTPEREALRVNPSPNPSTSPLTSDGKDGPPHEPRGPVCRGSVTLSSSMKVASGRRDSGFNTQQVGSAGGAVVVMTGW